MKKVNPVTECEELAQALHDLKKEILKTRFGKFMLWVLDRLSQAINWVKIKTK